MIKYSNRYYIEGIQITSTAEIWLKESDLDYIDHEVSAVFKGVKIRAFRKRNKEDELWMMENLSKQKELLKILSTIDFKKELDNYSKGYVSCILYNGKDTYLKNKKDRYSFSGYYDALEQNKKGYIYSLTLEKIVYAENRYEWDREKCKSLQVHISKNGKEKLEGDIELFGEYTKFERDKAAFLKHCEKEFAKCKGAFHLVKDKK